MLFPDLTDSEMNLLSHNVAESSGCDLDWVDVKEEGIQVEAWSRRTNCAKVEVVQNDHDPPATVVTHLVVSPHPPYPSLWVESTSMYCKVIWSGHGLASESHGGRTLCSRLSRIIKVFPREGEQGPDQTLLFLRRLHRSCVS